MCYCVLYFMLSLPHSYFQYGISMLIFNITKKKKIILSTRTYHIICAACPWYSGAWFLFYFRANIWEKEMKGRHKAQDFENKTEIVRKILSDCLVCTFSSPRFFFYFFRPPIVDFVNCKQCIYVRSHKLHFLAIFLLKIGLITQFTHLKIISLQCFQFQFSVSAKINSIQTHPKAKRKT